MKLFYYQCCLFFIFVYTSVSFPLHAQPQPIHKAMHITIPLSDKLSYRFEKYLLHAYNQLGYKVVFEKILLARARHMVDTGRLDAMMVAEKEIERTYHNILRVPVMLAKGALILYCNTKVNCQASELNNTNNTIGVISGNSLSGNYMRQMQASTYAVKSSENLGVMLTKGRLNYVLMVNENQLGNIVDFGDSQYQKIEVYRSEGYHYIHKKHKELLLPLTKALQLAIDKYGPLVSP